MFFCTGVLPCEPPSAKPTLPPTKGAIGSFFAAAAAPGKKDGAKADKDKKADTKVDKKGGKKGGTQKEGGAVSKEEAGSLFGKKGGTQKEGAPCEGGAGSLAGKKGGKQKEGPASKEDAMSLPFKKGARQKESPASKGPASKGPASKGPASKGPASKDPESKGPASKGPASKEEAPTASEDLVSLILFEEVDLVFDEDVGFYAALKRLARVAKCPIVATCNHIPEELDLGGALVLEWERPAEDQLVAYAVAVCDALGVVGSGDARLVSKVSILLTVVCL